MRCSVAECQNERALFLVLHFARIRLRLLDRTSSENRAIFLDPARLMRWVYVARVSIASAIFLAAVLASLDQPLEDSAKLLLASLTFAATLAVTGVSLLYSRINRGERRPTFYYLQTSFDLLLVTAVVHLTRDSTAGTSQFAELYILVIATASLMLPAGGALLVALLGNVLICLADSFFTIDASFQRRRLAPARRLRLRRPRQRAS